MIVDRYKKILLSIEDVYFSNEIIQSDVDISRYVQYYGMQKKDICKNEFFTNVILLDKPKEEIFKDFSKSTRSGINQARKNHGIITSAHSLQQCGGDFFNFYDKVATAKGIPVVNRDKITRLKDSVLITKAKLEDEVLVWHLYIYDDKRVRLLYSCSKQSSEGKNLAKIISKANKFLHYYDIGLSIDKGCRVFDFGGVSLTDEQVLGIDKFKLSFSKKIDSSCNMIIANSLLGRVFLFLYKAKNILHNKLPF